MDGCYCLCFQRVCVLWSQSPHKRLHEILSSDDKLLLNMVLNARRNHKAY